MHAISLVVGSALFGSACTLALARAWRRRTGDRAKDAKAAVTRLDAHMSSMSAPRFTPVSSTALRRDVQAVYETREASHDLEILDGLLRDVRDLSGADEAIFWRWVEARQTLVPSAWSTEGADRPAHFNMREWGSLVRVSAEEREIQLAGDIESAPRMASAPVFGPAAVFGVLTVASDAGLGLERDALRAWMPRFAAQFASLLNMFELRREYGRHMRQSEALLDAVKSMQQHRNAEALSQGLCETAREVTSASAAGLVRWNAAEKHGVVQAISPSGDLEPGFHVTADTLVGRVCDEKLPFLLEDARSQTMESDPYGGLGRSVGSLVIVPVKSAEQVIGAIIVEGDEPGQIGQHEARNAGLLAAVARNPLEIIWEIEEVSRRARTDGLTGLANRRHFDEQLRRVVAETDRFGGTCSLVLVDLDHFKQVNDVHGHDAGDAVLRHVSQVLVDTVRTVDLCARYGGEEIAVLLPQTTEQGAYDLAERLRSTLQKRPSSHGGKVIPVSASFGVATYPQPVPYGDWLVMAADKALYEAKAAGRNCVKVIQANQVTPALYKSR